LPWSPSDHNDEDGPNPLPSIAEWSRGDSHGEQEASSSPL
jgi:hypothetical protein